MTGLLTSPAVAEALPEAVPTASIVDEVEAWLRAHVKPLQPVQWRRRASSPIRVRGREHLAELLADLGEVGEWGVARRPQTGAWGQSMRVRDGWIVEVNGIPGPDCFARRVRAADSGTPGQAEPPPRAGGSGRPTATYRNGESIESATAAADILWSWLRGRLPAGYELRDVVEGVD